MYKKKIVFLNNAILCIIVKNLKKSTMINIFPGKKKKKKRRRRRRTIEVLKIKLCLKGH